MSVISAQQHPIGKKYRAMTPEEYAGLVNNIREKGQRLQITMHQGMVLDGWHRMRTCLELGKEPWVKEYGGSDPEGYCESLNDHRRHQTPSQRVSLALDKSGTGAGFDKTEAEIAAEADVSERTVRHAKIARTAGFAGMLDAGEIDAKPAAELARKAPEVAARVVAKEITPAEGKAQLQAKQGRSFAPPESLQIAALTAEKEALEAALSAKNAEILELELAGVDEGARNEARDKIQGYVDAMNDAVRQEAAAMALLDEVNYKNGELLRANNAQDAQIKRLKARIAELEK